MKAIVKKERGITLIALVITIIVLLILAGVSLSLVVGQNGVLNKATESVTATKKGTAIEQVSLAWTACQTDYLANNSGSEKSTFFTKEKLNSNLSQGEVTEVNFEKDANGSEVKYKLDNTTYTVIVTNDGVVKIAGEGTGSDPVTPPADDNQVSIADIVGSQNEYYGTKVTGYEANGISDWRIFYADESNVFLISTDYIPKGKALEANTTMTSSDDKQYSVWWSSVPTVASTTNVTKFSPVTPETMAWTGDYGTYLNGKCVSTILDTSKWTSFVDSNKAEMAIGSPTLNMWVASWNAKYPEDKIYCNNSTGMGYRVGTSSNPTSNYIDYRVMSAKDGYKVAEAENMYYPHKSAIDSNNCYGYWLASPTASTNDYVMSVGYNGVVGTDYRGGGKTGVRPVVCLKFGIEMTKNADGTITVGNVK